MKYNYYHFSNMEMEAQNDFPNFVEREVVSWNLNPLLPLHQSLLGICLTLSLIVSLSPTFCVSL